jgi:hypothetical protein
MKKTYSIESIHTQYEKSVLSTKNSHTRKPRFLLTLIACFYGTAGLIRIYFDSLIALDSRYPSNVSYRKSIHSVKSYSMPNIVRMAVMTPIGLSSTLNNFCYTRSE